MEPSDDGTDRAGIRRWWVVVHENARAGALVFLLVDGNVQVGRDSASC